MVAKELDLKIGRQILLLQTVRSEFFRLVPPREKEQQLLVS